MYEMILHKGFQTKWFKIQKNINKQIIAQKNCTEYLFDRLIKRTIVSISNLPSFHSQAKFAQIASFLFVRTLKSEKLQD